MTAKSSGPSLIEASPAKPFPQGKAKQRLAARLIRKRHGSETDRTLTGFLPWLESRDLGLSIVWDECPKPNLVRRQR